MIDVYFLDVSCFENKDLFDKYYQNVSEFRKEKIDRLKFIKDKKLSLGASALIDAFLKDKGYNEKEIEYSLNENGKPFFENLSVKFNISHSFDKVMVCFSDKEIGCDIEKIDDVDLNVAKRFFSDNEYKNLSNLTSYSALDYFYRIWTRKESFIKLLGKGMRIPLNSFDVDCIKNDFFIEYNIEKYYFSDIDFFCGYKCCICSNYKQKIKIKYIGLDENV